MINFQFFFKKGLLNNVLCPDNGAYQLAREIQHSLPEKFYNIFFDMMHCMCPNTGLFLVRIQLEYRKIRTRNNSLFGRFSCSDGFDMKSIIICCLGRDLEVSWIKGAVSGLRQFLANDGSLKMMKNAFYFTSKALSILKIFKFLSWLFGHVSKRLD